MDTIKADIIDYLGKYENGVIVLLTLEYKGSFTEGTIFYSDKALALTVSESLEKDLGCPIELWSGYKDLVISILNRVVPYNEIIGRLDEVDFSQYFSQTDTSLESEGENIDDDDIQTAN